MSDADGVERGDDARDLRLGLSVVAVIVAANLLAWWAGIYG